MLESANTKRGMHKTLLEWVEKDNNCKTKIC